jgi:regulatory protein
MSSLEKIKSYCAYQERSHQEVRYKLLELGVYGLDLENHITVLIEENFLNEERFAIALAGGKFRIKHWGKNKIRHALREKGVSSMLIESALKQIDLDEYYSVAEKLMRKKWMALGKTVQVETEVKIYRFMVARGFDASLAREIWKDILRQSPEHI